MEANQEPHQFRPPIDPTETCHGCGYSLASKREVRREPDGPVEVVYFVRTYDGKLMWQRESDGYKDRGRLPNDGQGKLVAQLVKWNSAYMIPQGARNPDTGAAAKLRVFGHELRQWPRSKVLSPEQYVYLTQLRMIPLPPGRFVRCPNPKCRRERQFL